jgi:hypothetical protein
MDADIQNVAVIDNGTGESTDISSKGVDRAEEDN